MTPISTTTHAAATLDGPEAKRSPEAERQLAAARQFEAIFVRMMLSSLEKTQDKGGGSQTGSAVYGSMMVNAIADVATQGEGLGLSELVLKALTPPASTTDPASPLAPTS